MSIHEEMLKSLTAQLRTAMQGRLSFETSQVRIIGLTQIKEGAGAAWQRFAARVRACSRQFIERRLGEGDIVIPAGDGFVVIYASPEKADEKSAALQRALNVFYLGEDGMGEITAEVFAKTIAAGHILDVLPDAPPPAARPLAAPPSAEPPPAAALQSQSEAWTPAGVETGLAVLPVWSSAQEAITGYWISPVQRGGGAPYYGYDRVWRMSGAPSQQDFAAVDQAILSRTVTAAQHCLDARRPCLIGYSVHASTLQHRERRQAFLQQLYAAPEAIRPYLLGRIAEITPGTPKAIITDWVQQLRPISPRVTVELHATERLTSGWKDVGIASVAWVVPSILADRAKMERYAHLIKTWGPILRREGLKFRLDNLASPELLARAVENGVDFCTSDWLWPGVAQPDGIKPFTLAQVKAGLRPGHANAMPA